MSKKQINLERQPRDLKPIERAVPEFKRKRSLSFVLDFLNTYFALILFLSRKFEVQPSRIMSHLFNCLYVEQTGITAVFPGMYLSSGMKAEGKLVWVIFSGYFESHEIKGLSYLSVSNLIRFCETDYSKYEINRPILFTAKRGIRRSLSIELNLPAALTSYPEIVRKVRKLKLLYRNSLANEYLLFLGSFHSLRIEYFTRAVDIVNWKYKEGITLDT